MIRISLIFKCHALNSNQIYSVSLFPFFTNWFGSVWFSCLIFGFTTTPLCVCMMFLDAWKWWRTGVFIPKVRTKLWGPPKRCEPTFYVGSTFSFHLVCCFFVPITMAFVLLCFETSKQCFGVVEDSGESWKSLKKSWTFQKMLKIPENVF